MSITIDCIEYYLPENILTNETLQAENPTWEMDNLYKKTGIYKRHIAAAGETAFDLSKKASDKIFNKNAINKNNIDGIIYCTQSQDYIMPSNAFLLHKYLNMKTNVFVYDFNHACTGYVYALTMAYSFITAGLAECLLLVTADTYSKYINKRDRSARVLFGDGAAVCVVKKTVNSKGLFAVDFASSGKNYDLFYIPAGGHRLPLTSSTSQEELNEMGNIRSQENIHMDGLGVWSFINSVVPKQINGLLEQHNLKTSDIDLFVFHQASKLTLDSLIKILKLDKDQVFMNFENLGNTVSASIPIALKNAVEQGKLKRGQKILISGFGVGMSCGAILMEY